VTANFPMTDIPCHQCPLRTLPLVVPYPPLCTLFTGWAFRFKTLRKLERRGLHRIDGGRLYLRDALAWVRLADLYGDGKPSPRPLI